MNGYHYLAAPYASRHAATRALRVQLATTHAAYLMARGLVVYSPITHGEALVRHGLPRGDWRFWAHPSQTMLMRAEMLRVLMLPGYQQSRGVQAEIGWALEMAIPVVWDDFLEPGA